MRRDGLKGGYEHAVEQEETELGEEEGSVLLGQVLGCCNWTLYPRGSRNTPGLACKPTPNLQPSTFPLTFRGQFLILRLMRKLSW